MKRVVDVFKNRGRDLVWTYVIHLGNADFHPAQLDFEIEALRLSQLDKPVSYTHLTLPTILRV